MSELSLPERLVHAAEMAIDEARICGVKGPNGTTTVEGYLTDFAKAAVHAAFKEWAVDRASRGFTYAALELAELADQVQDVRAVT